MQSQQDNLNCLIFKFKKNANTDLLSTAKLYLQKTGAHQKYVMPIGTRHITTNGLSTVTAAVH